MRKLLNILAVIIGLTGVSGVVVGGMLFVLMGVGCLIGDRPVSISTEVALLFGFGVGGGMAFIGGLIASRAWLHLRRPDAGTTSDMIGTAIYLITALAIFPLLKNSAWVLLLIFGVYLFHRWLVKRIAQWTVPISPLSKAVGSPDGPENVA
jgi:hypothetical protein